MTKKLLFVDDDPVFHFINSKIVMHLRIDCEIRMASNGRDALNIVSGNHHNPFVPDYIFVDLDMPVMDGFQFIKCFHALHAPGKENTIITILTSSNNTADRNRAYALGIENYVVKPIKAHDLLRILQVDTRKDMYPIN